MQLKLSDCLFVLAILVFSVGAYHYIPNIMFLKIYYGYVFPIVFPVWVIVTLKKIKDEVV